MTASADYVLSGPPEADGDTTPRVSVVGEAATSAEIHGTEPRADEVSTQLVPSAEPRIVFTSLGIRCVPALCDAYTADLTETAVDGTRADYRIVAPSPPDDVVPRHRTGPPPNRERVEFTGRAEDAFRGVATFEWQARDVSDGDRAMARMLVEYAVHTILWQRSVLATEAAIAKADNLERALLTSRQIGAAVGVIMALRKVTKDRAFDMLRTASQRSNRKLREIALDVVDTGWLDPALTDGT